MSVTIELTNTEAASNNRKSIINKTCASFVDCIIEINNTIHKQIMLKDIDVVMPMYNLLLIFLLVIITVPHLNLKLK